MHVLGLGLWIIRGQGVHKGGEPILKNFGDGNVAPQARKKNFGDGNVAPQAVAYLENLSGRGQNAKNSLRMKYTGNEFHHYEFR